MDTVTLQGVANTIVYIMPGYFAIRVYVSVFAREDKDFAKLVVESAVFSLVIVSVFNSIWQDVFRHKIPVVTNANYVLLLFIFSLACGWLAAFVRKSERVRQLGRQLGLPGPDEDFMKVQFSKLRKSESVTITLKDGSIFSGTPEGWNTFRIGFPRQYYFNNLAWYDKEKHTWNERTGSIIIDLNEVQYIETAKALPRD